MVVDIIYKNMGDNVYLKAQSSILRTVVMPTNVQRWSAESDIALYHRARGSCCLEPLSA